MKKLLWTAALGLALAPTGFAVAQDAPVYVLVPKALSIDMFYLPARDGCMAAAEELGVVCEYIGPAEHDEGAQIQVLQDLLTRGVTGITVAPINPASAGRIIDEMIGQGMLAITFDSDAPDSERPTYVGTDNYQMGVEIANLANAMKPEGGTFAVLTGGLAAQNLNARMQGVIDTLADNWTPVDGSPYSCNDSIPTAVQLVADILTQHPEIDAIFPVGGWPLMAPQGYRQALGENAERVQSGELLIVSADTFPTEIELLKEGLAHGLVGQRPYAMGYQSIYLLEALRKGEATEEIIYTGLDICTQENADSCLQGK